MKNVCKLGPDFSATRGEDIESIRALANETGRSYFEVKKDLGYTFKVVAKECQYCGAPMGSVDPDDPCVDEVVFGTCSDCRE